MKNKISPRNLKICSFFDSNDLNFDENSLLFPCFLQASIDVLKKGKIQNKIKIIDKNTIKNKNKADNKLF